MVPGVHAARTGILAGSLSESEATRRIVLAAGGLGLLGLVLLIATIWWWRATRAEHPSLAPLEVMSARRWHRASHAERTRLVEQVRPAGAAPVTPGAHAPEPVDLSVLAAVDHAGFDDLREIDELLGLRFPGVATVAPARPVEPGASTTDDDVDEPVDEMVDEPTADPDTAGVAAGDQDTDAAAEADADGEDPTAAIAMAEARSLLALTDPDSDLDSDLDSDDEPAGDLPPVDDPADESVVADDADDATDAAGGAVAGDDGAAIDPLLQRAANPD